MPGDLQMLWRAPATRRQYHVEYGYSCMGYEIAGGLGAKLADPEREVFVLVGDGSYLMMAQEIVTAVAERIKLVIVIVQNHGFASIGSLSESLGSQRFGTSYRYRDPETGLLDGDVLPVDLAANAASLGADVLRARTIAEFRDAPRRGPGRRTGPPLCMSKQTRSRPVPSSESWWDVPVSEASALEQHQKARAAYEAAKRAPATLSLKRASRSCDHPALDRRHRRRPGALDPGSARSTTRHRCAAGSGRAGGPTSTPRAQPSGGAWRSTSGATCQLIRRARIMFALRDLARAAPRRAAPGSSPTSTARSSRTPRARSSAAWRSSSSPAASRTCSRASTPEQVSTGVDAYSIRQPLGVVRRDHAVQLPGHGADVDAPDRDRVRQHVHPQAVSERDPSASNFIARAVRRGRAARRRVQRRARRQGRGRRDPRRTPTSRRCRSSARRRSPGTCYAARRRDGKRVQALGGAKNHAVVLPDADIDFAANHSRSPPATARPASAAWRSPSVVAVGDAGDALIASLRRRPGTCKVGARPRAAPRRWARWSPPQAADRISRLRRPRRRGRRHASSSTGHWLASAGTRTASASARACSTRSRTGDGHLPATRSSARSSSSLRVGTLRRGASSIDQRQPVRQRHRDLHLQRPAPRRVPARGAGRDDRHQRPDPGADGLLLLRRLEGLAVRRHRTSTARRASRFYTAPRRSPAAGPTPTTPTTTARTCTSRPLP